MRDLSALLPPGSCDCHVHVIGPVADYPMVLERHYTPGPASAADLRAHMARNALQRAVIVQPSVYGTDNRCMLASLRELGGAGRGVAVVERDVSEQALRELSAQGVRGLRVNVESASMQNPKAIGFALAYWAKRVAALGWHLQLYAAFDALAAAVPYLRDLSVPLVLDHFAMAPAATPADDARLQAVLSLVRAGKAYVKLSAPYRIHGAGHGTHDADDVHDAVARLAAIYVNANPDRILWGSDWPHTNREPGKATHEVSAYRPIAPLTLLQGIEAWLPGDALRDRVLVSNPAQLYGF